MDSLKAEIEKVREYGRYDKVADEAERMINRATPDEKALKDLRAKSALGSIGSWVLFLTPFFLAIALALRITKVTAEVFVISKATNHHNAPEPPSGQKHKSTQR